jgi:flagellar capping protein FliD
MSSPITLTGFNNIDWSSVLEALMQQESQPLSQLQNQRSDISAQQSAFSTYATKLSTLESAVQDRQLVQRPHRRQLEQRVAVGVGHQHHPDWHL